MRDPKPLPRATGAAGVCLLLVLAHSGCGLDNPAIPGLSGPSELGIAVTLTASPDVLTADGFSTALIQVQVFNQNGQPLAGSTILLALKNSNSGSFVDLGTLYSPTGNLLRAAEATVVTNGSGVATAVYTSPPRTDFTANGSVVVAARPVGTDANGVAYRSVTIELKSAEPRLFAGSTVCGFAVEAPSNAVSCSVASGLESCTVKVGSQVLFQSTSIAVRYLWYWGDGTPSGDAPNENHVFRTVGDFTVTHVVTDAAGGQAACSADMSVVP